MEDNKYYAPEHLRAKEGNGTNGDNEMNTDIQEVHYKRTIGFQVKRIILPFPTFYPLVEPTKSI